MQMENKVKAPIRNICLFYVAEIWLMFGLPRLVASMEKIICIILTLAKLSERQYVFRCCLCFAYGYLPSASINDLPCLHRNNLFAIALFKHLKYGQNKWYPISTVRHRDLLIISYTIPFSISNLGFVYSVCVCARVWFLFLFAVSMEFT